MLKKLLKVSIVATLGFTAAAATANAAPVLKSAARLAWAPCPDADPDSPLECTSVDVPIDYGDSSKGSIALAVARVPAADPSKKVGSIFSNPGGPGGSGVDFVESFASGLPPDLLERFDIVSWDPRGVGRSAGIDCKADPPLPGIDYERIEAEFRTWAAQCKAENAELLPYIGTINTARDLERLRIAVGDKKLTYLGYSYGTLIGQTYAALHPKNIRAMVLDGNVPMSIDTRETWGRQYQSIENSLNRFFDACAAEPTCPFAPNPKARWAALRDKVVNGGLPVTSGPNAGKSVDLPLFEGASIIGLYIGPGFYPRAAQAMADAEGGDAANLYRFGAAFASDFYEQYVGVLCADFPDRYNASEARAFYEELAPTVASFRAGAGYELMNCTGWDVTPQTPLTWSANRKVTAPIVTIGTVFDPATPYSLTQEMTGLLNATLITFASDGHTIYGSGLPCIDDPVNEYLLNVTVPASGIVCEPVDEDGNRLPYSLPAPVPAAG